MELTELEIPGMRSQLIGVLSDILELSRTRPRHTTSSDTPPTAAFAFGHIVNFFFDDTVLSEDSEKAVGIFLLNKEEAKTASKLVSHIDAMLDEVGAQAPDVAYVHSTHWRQVVSTADIFISQLESN